MALINEKAKEVNAKIVYYGPALSGKTTNIQFIYRKLKPEHKGKLMTLSTQTERTLFFDFLPIELGEIKGLRIRFQLYTVPGQIFYSATRRLVLKNVDGVVFVADSAEDKLQENIDSLKDLHKNLGFHKLSLDKIPHVFQYNKRDLDNALPVDVLNNHLNQNRVPYFEAIATKGVGVLETLTSITKLVVQKLRTAKDLEERVRQMRREEAAAQRNNTTSAAKAQASSNTRAVIEDTGPPSILPDGSLSLPIIFSLSDTGKKYQLEITLNIKELVDISGKAE